MSLHYPLNGVDLDFRRYSPRPLGGRDILVNRIMDDYMIPRRVKASTYLRKMYERHAFSAIKSQDRQLGLDLQVLSKLLETHTTVRILLPLRDLEKFEKSPAVQDWISDLVQRYFMEISPELSYYIKSLRLSGYISKPVPPPCWKKDMVAHIKQFQTAAAVHHQNSLVSGYQQPPLRVFEWRDFSPDPSPPSRVKHQVPQIDTINIGCIKARREGYIEKSLDNTNVIRRGRPRRSHSLPLPNSWLRTPLYPNPPILYQLVYSPRLPLSKVDKLSRRRSLSRTHIEAMFHDPPEWILKGLPDRNSKKQVIKHSCTNCGVRNNHFTKDCPLPCGYCDSSEHKARNCTIKAVNRCKCRPFPQRHTAPHCSVPCSRRCGSPYPPNHAKHKSAMMCAYRCCMCGVKGHTGRKCALKRCPCGGQHLTQDCRWKVECPARGCDRYLCPLHCRECGVRNRQNKGFVGGICQGCLKKSTPVSAKAE
ncbi:hypothetical protein F4810DRAFT_714153 [Camillea tinctor]|nr:hypothetical protein F4810DRAFT_714153 [Camillea tinctor]